MKVGQRLFLAVVPAILGLFLVAALDYWGQYAHEVPALVIALAAIAALASLIVAWRNTRYVAQRVASLAERAAGGVSRASPSTDDAVRASALRELGFHELAGGVGSRADELDAIEHRVAGLSSAVVAAREDGTRRERAAGERVHEYESLLDAVTRRLDQRMQDAQLPLHILLSSPFGALNENQEEMLSAAQSAVDAADAEVRQLRKLLELDRGAVAIMRQPIGLGELLRPALAIAEAKAARAGAQLSVTVSDVAPRAIVDPVHAQDALTTVFADVIARAPIASEIGIDARESDTSQLRITVNHPPDDEDALAELPIEMRLAQRLLAAQGASLVVERGRAVIDLPAERLGRVVA